MTEASEGYNFRPESRADSTSTESIALFRDPRWLCFKHDGYPLTTIGQYRVVRGIENPALFDRYHVSILQSWLSFGLLEAVLEVSIPESKLIKQDEQNGLVMTLDGLPQILSEWVSIVRIENEDLVKYRHRVESILTQVHKILSYLSESKAFEYPDAYLDDVPATFVALGCVAEALTQAKHCLYPEAPPKEGYSWDFVVAPYHEKFYADAIDAGWCLSTINFLVNKVNLAALRFAIRRGPLIPREHHDKCSAQFCSLKLVDTTNYVPKHLGSSEESSCSCSYIKPPIDTIISIIQQGSNPLVTLLDIFDRESTSLRVRESPGVPYVAISHVWADGCGSTAEKGLPLCQLWKLSAMVSGIIPNGAFWMDSLCVPKHAETRKQALKLMGKAYLDAEIVLVLDSTIQSCSSRVPLKELLLHIVMSPWMRRLWTLQEAVLAKKLVFMFSDGLVPLSKVIPDVSSLYQNTIEAGLAAEVHRLTKLRLFDNLTFADVARSLRWRWTSNLTDEVPAIVSLVKVNRDAIFEGPVAKRMVNLLLDVANLSSNIIFLDGPKMDIPGFRWSPSTLMSIATGADGGGLELSTMNTGALCTPRGLVAEYFVFRFEGQRFEADEIWTLCDSPTNRIFFVCNLPGSKKTYRCNALLCDRSTAPSGMDICVAVLGDTDANDNEMDCVYVARLKINGQRPDKTRENKVVDVLTSGRSRICIS